MASLTQPPVGQSARNPILSGIPRGTWARCLALCGALFLALAGPAVAQSSEPSLRIEAVTHTSKMTDGAADRAGRILVTTSYDKTARVWSLPDLRLLAVLRPPIGDGHQGKLYAVAVSPDAKTVAVGGFTEVTGTVSVYVFDIATRAIVHEYTGLPDAVESLAFAPDGRLAAGMDGKNGIRVWNPNGDLQFQDTVFGASVYGVAFAPDGRLAAGSYDGSVRLYRRDGTRTKTEPAQVGKLIYRVRFSPDGSRLAMGFADVAAVEVRDGATLALLAKPNVAGLAGGELTDVAWNASGNTLFAGGDVWERNNMAVYSWSDAGSGPRRVAANGFGDGVGAIVPLSGGRLALASTSGDIAVSNSDLTRVSERRLLGGDLRRNADPPNPGNLRVAADGERVEWFTIPAEQRLVSFDPTKLDLRVGDPPIPGLASWSTEAPGLKVTDWSSRTDPKLNGHPLTLEPQEVALSASIDHDRLLLGTAWYLRMFNAAGAQIWRQSVSGPAWRVNQSADGRLLVAALGDSTIRWYRADTGQELLALYITEDAQKWIAFTPSGYYAAAPGAEDLIGWHVNRGPSQAADFFSVGQFRDRFYRPDVVSRVLSTLDEAQALRQADAIRGVATKTAEPITQDLPPVLHIVTPKDGTTVNGDEVTLDYTVRSPSGKPLSAVTILIDGQRPAFGEVPAIPVITGKDQETKGQLAVPIPAGKTVEIALLASTTRDGLADRIRVTSTAPPVDLGLPRLNGVLVGISNYTIPGMKLNFAAKDARDIQAEFEKQHRSGLYRDVNLPIVPEKDATRRGILAALRALRERNTPDDVALVFLSGHGAQVGSRTFFLPIDAVPDDLDGTAISKADLLDILSSIKGKVLLFLDICHAGAFEVAGQSHAVPDMTLLMNEFRDSKSGIVVFSSSTGSQLSEELPTGNGAFTAAVLDGLNGAAAVRPNGMIDTDDLNTFVKFDVRKLTQGRQSADMLRPPGMPDFPIFALGH